jgi:ABC-type multidrug transport system fused ATPase/permease subunit
MNTSLEKTLHHIFSKYRGSILLTYGLTLLENLFELLHPLTIGIAINGLLKQSYGSMTPFAAAWLVHALVSVFRQVYDTRIFSRIYTNLATSTVLEQTRQGIPLSQIAARSSLSRELVGFFERDIPEIMNSIFGFVGALVMLFTYDWQIGFYCLLLLLPLSAANYIYSYRTRLLHQKLNDQLECEVQILSHQQPDVIQSHYSSLAKWRIQLSNAEAATWGTFEIFIVSAFTAILIRTVTSLEAKTGDIYAIISYAWSYRQSLDRVPFLVQQFTRLQDIGSRLS